MLRKGSNLLNQYSMNFFSTVPVVPSAMISKKEAISPQLKPSASLDSECSGIHVFNVVTSKHTVLKDLEVDVLAIARDVAMVGQGVETRTGTTSFTEQLAYGEYTYP
ncbi:hypothetical protein HG530_011356 [Fusarium avenaceum]|nr:hypothetical protein HG530_011356 [Fusarium avenaceum]